MAEDIPEFGAVTTGADYLLRPGGYVIAKNTRGEIAIISTPRGFFLPGGGQESGETPEQAAIREAEEEGGLGVRLTRFLGRADELVYAAEEGIHYRKRCSFFSAELTIRRAGGEADHLVVWMAPEEAVTRLRHRSQRWAVMEASRLRTG
jgi:8-oxo-dGTP diphosphatase